MNIVNKVKYKNIRAPAVSGAACDVCLRVLPDKADRWLVSAQ